MVVRIARKYVQVPPTEPVLPQCRFNLWREVRIFDDFQIDRAACDSERAVWFSTRHIFGAACLPGCGQYYGRKGKSKSCSELSWLVSVRCSIM
jgi:hypothetical protein